MQRTVIIMMRKIMPAFLVVILFSTQPVMAKRRPKPEIPSIRFQGVEYRIEYFKSDTVFMDQNWHPAMSGPWLETRLKAVDLSNQEILLERLISSRSYDPQTEDDAQWVFVKEFRLQEPDRLVIINEEEKEFVFDLETRQFRRDPLFTDYLPESPDVILGYTYNDRAVADEIGKKILELLSRYADSFIQQGRDVRLPVEGPMMQLAPAAFFGFKEMNRAVRVELYCFSEANCVVQAVVQSEKKQYFKSREMSLIKELQEIKEIQYGMIGKEQPTSSVFAE